MAAPIENENSDLALALKRIRRRIPLVRKYRNYYEGEHDLVFATEKYIGAFGETFKAFADNFCGTVIDVLSDRLQLTGFGTTAPAKVAWQMWQDSLLGMTFGELFQDALLVGDAYLLIWPNAENTRQPDFFISPPEQTTVYYDPEQPRSILWAAKLWSEPDGSQRLTLYYRDRIEKYKSESKSGANVSAKGFKPYQPDGDQAWPVPHNLGRVPIFHFPNNAFLGRLGISELKSIIPIQNAINKILTDMLVAAEFAAFPQRWATGIEPDDAMEDQEDAAGNVVKVPKFRPGIDRIWAVANELAKMGQFEAANLLQFLAVKESLAKDIARIGRVPLHYIEPSGGNPPSGEALKTAEQPTNNKAVDRQTVWGEVVRDAILFALAIMGTPAKRGDIAPDWKDPTPKSEKEAAETAEIKGRIGVPLRVLLRELQYTETEIIEMLDQKAKDEQAATDQVLARLRADQLAAQSAANAALGQTQPQPNGAGAIGDTAPLSNQ